MDVITYKNKDGSTKTLTKISFLGKGAYGQVYKYLLEGYGYVAVKKQRYTVSLYTEIKISPILTEYSSSLRKVIVNSDNNNFDKPFYDEYVGKSSDVEKSNVYIIYDLIEGIEFSEMISINKSHQMLIEPKILLRYISELLKGLKEMIDHKICHRDIKPQNIMLDKGKIKYIDFGSTCFYPHCQQYFIGTPNFSAPEAFIKRVGDWSKVDIYAVGCVLLFATTYKKVWTDVFKQKT